MRALAIVGLLALAGCAWYTPSYAPTPSTVPIDQIRAGATHRAELNEGPLALAIEEARAAGPH